MINFKRIIHFLIMNKILLLLFTFFSSQATAQVYLEGGASFVSYKNSFGTSRIVTNQQIGRLIVGYEASEIWSGEFMSGIGQLSNSSVYLNNVAVPDLDVKFSKAYGVYIKSKKLFGDGLYFFGRVGYASVAGVGSYHSANTKFDESGGSYGVGVGLNLGKSQYLSFDYLSFLSNNEMQIKLLSIGYSKSL